MIENKLKANRFISELYKTGILITQSEGGKNVLLEVRHIVTNCLSELTRYVSICGLKSSLLVCHQTQQERLCLVPFWQPLEYLNAPMNT